MKTHQEGAGWNEKEYAKHSVDIITNAKCNRGIQIVIISFRIPNTTFGYGLSLKKMSQCKRLISLSLFRHPCSGLNLAPFFFRCVTSSKMFAKFFLKQISWLARFHFGIWPKSVFIQFESLSVVKLFFGKGCRLSFLLVSICCFFFSRQQFSSNVLGKLYCLHCFYTVIFKFTRAHVQPIIIHQTEAVDWRQRNAKWAWLRWKGWGAHRKQFTFSVCINILRADEIVLIKETF